MEIRCSLRGASFSWPGGREILRAVTADWFLEGIVALCGPNGSGKSTLLSLLGGELSPTSGSLALFPPQATRMEQRLEDFACSPGERQRERIEEVFRDSDGLLLLDEPANHLDAQARSDLERRLRRHGGPVLLVSHDRDLLDKIATRTLWLEDGEVHATDGGFSRAWEARERRLGTNIALREAQDRRRGALQARIQQGRQAQQGAGRDRTAGRRMKDRNDRDATSMAADFRFRTAQASLGGRLGKLSAELERLEAEPRVEVRRDTLRDLEFPWDQSAGRRLSLPAGSVEGLGGFRLPHGGVALDSRDRIRLRGPNGSGKSTLLRALARSAPPGTTWLPQEPTREEDHRLLGEIKDLDKAEMGRFLSLVAALGAQPSALRESAAPSPGEARKLRLALALSRPSWMLLLDEPTNHLDAACAQRLEEALERWPGGLVLSTHDERLARALSLREWHLEGGRLWQG